MDRDVHSTPRQHRSSPQDRIPARYFPDLRTAIDASSATMLFSQHFSPRAAHNQVTAGVDLQDAARPSGRRTGGYRIWRLRN